MDKTVAAHAYVVPLCSVFLAALVGCGAPAPGAPAPGPAPAAQMPEPGTTPGVEPPGSTASDSGSVAVPPSDPADGSAPVTADASAPESADASAPETTDASPTPTASVTGGPTPAIYLLADIGSWEAPQAVFVSGLPPVPHVCFSDGTTVGTAAQVPKGADVEGPNPLAYPTPNGPSTSEIAMTKTIRACLKQRDLAYNADASTKLLAGGDPLKANFLWDFGDPGAAFDQVAGFSAAHLYEAAGTYTIKLTVTNELGQTGQTTTQVVVKASTRKVIDVATQTDFDAVASAQGGGREIRLARGASFVVASAMKLGSNDHVTAHGSGNAPVLECEGCTGMFDLNHASLVHDVIEHVELRVQTGTKAPIMTEPGGTNAVLSDVSFTRDSASPPRYAGGGRFVTVYGNGVLLQGNGMAPAADGTWQTDGLRENFAFIQGSSVALYGNHVYEDAADQNAEPAIRTCSAGVAFVSVVGNEIGGFFGKTNEVTLRAGHNLYVGGNTILGGVMDVRDGCTPLDLTPGESTANVVIEGNHTENTQIAITTPGIYGVMERNNYGHMTVNPDPRYPSQGDSLATVSAPSSVGTTERVFFVNNTYIFDRDTGKAFDFGSDWTQGSISLINNLVVAPYLAAQKRPVINMSTAPDAMAIFALVEGNAFLLTPDPTLAKVPITSALDFAAWNAGAMATGTHVGDAAFDVGAGGFAGAQSGQGIDNEYEAYRPTAGAAFAASSVNVAAPAAPALPAASTDTFGVTGDLSGHARPGHGAGGWTPGALQAP